MRPRIPVTPEQIKSALVASDGDIEGAADALRVDGVAISGRTLRRRMGELGIEVRRDPTIHIQEEAA